LYPPVTVLTGKKRDLDAERFMADSIYKRLSSSGWQRKRQKDTRIWYETDGGLSASFLFVSQNVGEKVK